MTWLGLRTSIEFKDPWVLAFIPVLLILVFIFRRPAKVATFFYPSITPLKTIGDSWKTQFLGIPFLLRCITLVLFSIALAAPRSVLEESQAKTEGIDIILSLDTSGSMAAEDFTINGHRQNRLDVIKNVVEEFVNQRKNDRLSLVAFASKAYTVCPLTTDYDWLKTNLERLELGLIEDGTAIGSAILTSTNRLKNSTAKSKVVILLTDGVNNAGKVDPLTAAKTAQKLGIKIYTIGAGTKGYAPFPVSDIFGRKLYQNVLIEIDDEMLTKVAEFTGGKYFRATDTESLRKIYKEIDSLEKTTIEHVGYKEYKELFGQVLSVALILLLLEVILTQTIFLKIP
jgi:Ca-activated chloride channel family protein